jgi:c-di-GMP-binding flagellar brake protein YcgR
MAEPQAAPNSGIFSRYLTDRADIIRVLRQFRDNCQPVTVRFEGNEQEFTAQVLDVTDDELLLEDVRPRNGIALMQKRQPFALAGRADGVYVYATDNRVSESASERLVPYFRVPLPRSMLCQQRRKSTRFQLPMGERDATVELTRGDAIATGEIIDISAGGCRAGFRNGLPLNIAKDLPNDTCRVEVAGLLSLECAAVIRHVSANGARAVVCGIEFTSMGLTERRRLEQFIQTLSRTLKPV